jgi:putative flippase GtrA
MGVGLVGVTGIAVNQAAYVVLSDIAAIQYLVAAILATQVSTTWNFVAIDQLVFRDRARHRPAWLRYLMFSSINNGTLLLRLPLLWALTDLLLINHLWSNLISLVVLFAVRYAFADLWVWSSSAVTRQGDDVVDAPSRGGAAATGPRSTELVASQERVPRFGYDIAGILRIDSQIELRELAYFRSEAEDDAEVRIRVGRVGALPSRRTRFTEDGATLSYLEHLGAVSANFRIVMGDPIQIQVAPLLAGSPHVLYTNVVEALLRFLLVSKDHVLLHSACVMRDGEASLLSARTDTGKTSTVIQLVRDHGFTFLSDDMTILTPDGRAICYPKPMTLSFHTMSAIRGGELPVRKRLALAIQSRLHSKSGRSAGQSLARLNIPIMSVNAVVQMLVPPPKHRIDALLPCVIERQAPIGHVFVMERGPAAQEELSIDDAIATLIENTDDAYGFPPFATFAPHLRINGDDYAELRRKEELLLRAALRRSSLHRVRVPGHEWADVLPDLMRTPAPGGPPRPVVLPVDSLPRRRYLSDAS